MYGVIKMKTKEKVKVSIDIDCLKELGFIHLAEVEKIIDLLKEKAIKDICKNMNVKRKTLCQFGNLGLMTIEELVEIFYGEELKQKLKGEEK